MTFIIGLIAPLAYSNTDVDITDRKQTDPLLEIHTSKELLPEDSALFQNIDPTNAEIQQDRTPNTYKRLWGKKDVLMVHPVKPDKPGLIDFSKIKGYTTSL